MGETVDVLVIGESRVCPCTVIRVSTRIAGNYGTGRRSGGVSTLICAVLDDRRKLNDDEDPK